ncbi:hypothetical protein DAEQUDRAFT_770215 [Daedalea quercina L-15889]|uniref:Uncharacterized protein n=1 Tax=Daedalea quercina L-15889 TaxID=1314783 RepID=A0A165L0U5_9APHY|nr:hypothetical protein DAEQUDRAFT_770215 [Daedalea quercina L-15889]
MKGLLPVLVETIEEVLLIKNHLEAIGGGSYLLGKERARFRETLSKRSGCRGGSSNGANGEWM